MTTVRTLRLTLGAVGVVTLGYGVYGLVNEHVITDRAAVGEWLIAGVIGHDFLLAPIVFVLCAIAYRCTDARWRGRLAAFLLIGGSLVAITIPALIRQGLNRNTTVLPLDYARNLTVLLAVLAAIMVVYSIADRTRRSRAARKAEAAEAAEAEAEVARAQAAKAEAAKAAAARAEAAKAAAARAEAAKAAAKASIKATKEEDEPDDPRNA